MRDQITVSCLWFQREAKEAAETYCEIIPDSRIHHVVEAPEGHPLGKGTPMAVQFEIGGVVYLALNGREENGFNHSFSICVNCDTQAEIDRLWEKLSAGGKEGRCGWLSDRFGVHWQVVPREMAELMQNPKAAMALMDMTKIDVAALKAAGKDS
ncbi:VOC family protein [Paracoccaceae bacterium GXU_MW_L88]